MFFNKKTEILNSLLRKQKTNKCNHAKNKLSHTDV